MVLLSYVLQPSVDARPAIELPEARLAGEASFIHVRHAGSGRSPIALAVATEPADAWQRSGPPPARLSPGQLAWMRERVDTATSHPDGAAAIAEVRDCRFGQLVVRIVHQLAGSFAGSHLPQRVHCGIVGDRVSVNPGDCEGRGEVRLGDLIYVGDWADGAFADFRSLHPLDVAHLRGGASPVDGG